jgi:hypothetical protein
VSDRKGSKVVHRLGAATGKKIIMSAMEVDKPTSSKGEKKRFEVKKWNAVALWAWGMYLV